MGGLGAYQVQAAIAAAHSTATAPEHTDWGQIAQMYGHLAKMTPSPVIELNRAVAVAMAGGPEHGLELIDRPEVSGELEEYRWLHSTRADLLRRLERFDEAAEEYRKALTLSENAAERTFLGRRLGEVEGAGNASR